MSGENGSGKSHVEMVAAIVELSLNSSSGSAWQDCAPRYGKSFFGLLNLPAIGTSMTRVNVTPALRAPNRRPDVRAHRGLICAL